MTELSGVCPKCAGRERDVRDVDAERTSRLLSTNDSNPNSGLNLKPLKLPSHSKRTIQNVLPRTTCPAV